MGTDPWIEVLRQSSKLRTEAELLNFDTALRKLAEQPLDARLLPALFCIFDDSAEHLPLMWGLLHYIEGFEMESELIALIQATPILLEQARTWAGILYSRVLNEDNARNLLRTLYRSLPSEAQDFVRRALDNVTDDLSGKNEMLHLKLRLEAKFVLT